MRTLSATLLLALLPSVAGAAPPRITGKVLHPPKDVQVELRPWATSHEEVLRRLSGESVPPIASIRPQADGSFLVAVPESGFYSLVARAEGRLAMERFVRFVVEETEVPEVELPAAEPLEVRAVGPDGKPIAGAVIQAIPQQEEGDWRTAERRGVTDAEGRVVFPRAKGEVLALTVTTPGLHGVAFTQASGASQTVRFPAPRSRVAEIRGPNGRPAAGALVRFARRGWPIGLSGPDGRIALPVPAGGEIELVAQDSRGLRAEIGMTAEGTDLLVVDLRSPVTVTGRTLDPSSREPVAGALVWTGGAAWTRTDAGGRFEVRVPWGDLGEVEASAAGRLAQTCSWQRQRNEPVTFLLERAADISGQVVDEAGKPVEGARITTVTNPESFRSFYQERSTESGPEGRFVLRKLPDGRLHAVAAVREGYAPARGLADSTAPVRLVLRRGALAVGRVVSEEGLPVAGAFGYRGREVRQIRIPEEGEVPPVEIVLEPGAGLTGQVLDSQGLPLPRAAVRAENRARGLTVSSSSGENGVYRIDDIEPGPYEVEARLPEAGSSARAAVVIRPGGNRLDIRFQAGVEISGRVVDSRGAPVPGASLSLLSTRPDASFASQVTSSGDGSFAFRDVVDGEYRLSAARQGFGSSALPDTLRVEGAPVAGIELRLGSGAVIRGRILGLAPEEMPRVVVIAFSEHVLPHLDGRVQPDGSYHVRDASPGEWHVAAQIPPLSASGTVRITPGEEEAVLDLEFPAGFTVTGRVFLDREPLPGADVVAGQLEGSQHRQGRTGPEGDFRLERLPAGRSVLSVAFSSASLHYQMLEIDGDLDLLVEIATGTVRGRLLLPEGLPVAGAAVTLAREIPELQATVPGASARADAKGAFEIPKVPAGTYRLTVEAPGFSPAESRVVVAPGGTVQVDLALSPAGAQD